MFAMNRLLIFWLYVFVSICVYADTAEYLKKISDSLKIYVHIQPKAGSAFALNIQNLKLCDDVLYNESAFNKNVEVIVCVGTIDKQQQEGVRVYGCGTSISSYEKQSFSKTLKSKYLIYQPTMDFLRKLKEISSDSSIEKIRYIEGTFSFFGLLKSNKIDLSKTIVRSETVCLEGEELNAWLNFARSLPPTTKNSNEY